MEVAEVHAVEHESGGKGADDRRESDPLGREGQGEAEHEHEGELHAATGMDPAEDLAHLVRGEATDDDRYGEEGGCLAEDREGEPGSS